MIPIQNPTHNPTIPAGHRNLTYAIPFGSNSICGYGPPHNRVVFSNELIRVNEVLGYLPSAANETLQTYRDFIIDGKLHHNGNTLFISNSRAHCIYVIDFTARRLLFTIGNPGQSSFKDGEYGLLSNPGGIAPLRNKDLLIADFGNNAIRRFIWNTRKLETVCGQPKGNELLTMRDGLPSVARLVAPCFIVAEPVHEQYAYFSDAHSIRRVHLTTKIVSTIAGICFSGGWVDEIGLAARFFQPTALAMDYRGHLIVSDTGNKTLRVIDLATNRVDTMNSEVSLREPTSLQINEMNGELIVTDRKLRSTVVSNLPTITGKHSFVISTTLVWKRFHNLVRFLAITRCLEKPWQFDRIRLLFKDLQKSLGKTRLPEEINLLFALIGRVATKNTHIDEAKYILTCNSITQKTRRRQQELRQLRLLIGGVIAKDLQITQPQYQLLLKASQLFTKDTQRQQNSPPKFLNLIPQTPNGESNHQLNTNVTNPVHRSLTSGTQARIILRRIFFAVISQRIPYQPPSLKFLAEPPDSNQPGVWITEETNKPEGKAQEAP